MGLNRKAPVAGAFLIWALLAPAAAAQLTIVRQAIDGDSVLLADGRQARLIGINAPELGGDRRPAQPLAGRARDRLAQLVNQRTVRLTFGPETTDRHGRLLTHVALTDGTDVQRTLLREGLVWCVAIPPNTERAEAYCAAEREARAQGRGVWAEAAYAPTAAARLTPRHTGFRLVRGTVARIGHSRYAVYLDLHPHFTIQIPRQAWAEIRQRHGDLQGRPLVARGWVTEYKNGLRLRLAHPAMIETSTSAP